MWDSHTVEPTRLHRLKRKAHTGRAKFAHYRAFTNEKQNIEIINIIIETLQEMLPEGDPRKALVSTDLITYVEDRKGHDRRYAIAPDKIKEEIGWYPEPCLRRELKRPLNGSLKMRTGWRM